MPDITQLPENVTVTCVHGDALTIKRSLGFDTTGDTLTAVVYEDTAAGYAAALFYTALQLTDDELIAGILGNDLKYTATLATYERHGVFPGMKLYRRENIDEAATKIYLGSQKRTVYHGNRKIINKK